MGTALRATWGGAAAGCHGGSSLGGGPGLGGLKVGPRTPGFCLHPVPGISDAWGRGIPQKLDIPLSAVTRQDRAAVGGEGGPGDILTPTRALTVSLGRDALSSRAALFMPGG